MKPKALVLHAAGTNRDFDACTALKLADADPEIVHINQLKSKEKNWKDYSLLVIPGGFSYADALGAGKLFALDLSNYFFDEINEFIAKNKPVIGICNGFQVLVKAGILPGAAASEGIKKESYKNRKVTLTNNKQGRFECRKITMIPAKSVCIWTKNLKQNITCPIAHGEGRFLTDTPETLKSLYSKQQIALLYAGKNAAENTPAAGEYPYNPNGSIDDIAGICNEKGTVLGLMPHPENNVVIRDRDSKEMQEQSRACLQLWQAGVDYVR